MYKVVRWHKGAPRYQLPPLYCESNGETINDPHLKALLLHKTLLCRNLEVNDISSDTPTVPLREIPWRPISKNEAFKATCQITSSAPGEDEVTSSVRNKAWPILGERLTSLFNECIRLGTHPQTFKTANIVILPKVGKRNRALPKSYRPIALLSCLGKGLNRIIVRRISYWALKLKILARDQCSAISHRSAVDLTTVLHSDIRAAWEKRKVAGIITVDVKGAFDGVLRNRLIHRLRTQGWPSSLVAWIEYFLSKRTARICLDNIKTEPLPILCGLPQGSPISPILFLLYIEPVLRLSRGRFGYADDAAILATVNTLSDCYAKLQKQFDIAISWGLDNGIMFDNAKTEPQYFHRKRKFSEPTLIAGDKEITANDCTRWLGIYFDRKLTFKEHVRRASQRARVITDHIRQLGNTTQGAKPALLR